METKELVQNNHMVNYKTILNIAHEGDKYSLDSGQNRINSADYIYMLYKNNQFMTTICYQKIKTGKITFCGLEFVPTVVVNKIKNYLNS